MIKVYGCIWNPSNCKCDYDKSCDIGGYSDYENCECRKKFLDKLVDECTETIDEETNLVKITSTKCKHNLAYFTVCCFQYSLQSALELLLILFTINA